LDRLRDLFESITGTRVDSRDVKAIAETIGIDLSDSEAVGEFESRWQATQAGLAAAPPLDDAFGIVEPVFQDVIERYPGIFDPESLAMHPPATRMLIATRAIDAQVDNGGWPAVFYNSAVDLLPAAIEGYRLLGLERHAALASRIAEHGWIEPTGESPDDPSWEAFDAEWFALEDAEAARARFIREHPTAFGSDVPGASMVDR
jgi:hypothetical protein